jgi:hypothetical protein
MIEKTQKLERAVPFQVFESGWDGSSDQNQILLRRTVLPHDRKCQLRLLDQTFVGLSFIPRHPPHIPSIHRNHTNSNQLEEVVH